MNTHKHGCRAGNQEVLFLWRAQKKGSSFRSPHLCQCQSQPPALTPIFLVAGNGSATLCLIMLYYVIILFYLITEYSNILHTLLLDRVEILHTTNRPAFLLPIIMGSSSSTLSLLQMPLWGKIERKRYLQSHNEYVRFQQSHFLPILLLESARYLQGK